MFNTLASYLLGSTSAASVPDTPEVRLTSVPTEDDWVLIDRTGSAGESDAETSIGSISGDNNVEDDDDIPTIISRASSSSSIHRSSSCSSLPRVPLEDSWFITPPPCFTSAGPIHMETSPLENLLIEHPSMSVYQHSSCTYNSLRRLTRPSSSSGSSTKEEDEEEIEIIEVVEPSVISSVPVVVERVMVDQRPQDAHNSRPNNVHYNTLRQQQERQCLNVKDAQKVI